MIDVDGVLASLDAYDAALTPDARPPPRRDGRSSSPTFPMPRSSRPVTTWPGPYTVSATPSSTPPHGRHTPRRPTKSWLTVSDFPPGRALLTRTNTTPGLHPQPAWQTKLAHTRAVTNRHPEWLRAFVDDDPAILAKLTASGIPAVSPHALTGLTVTALRSTLDGQPHADGGSSATC